MIDNAFTRVFGPKSAEGKMEDKSVEQHQHPPSSSPSIPPSIPPSKAPIPIEKVLPIERDIKKDILEKIAAYKSERFNKKGPKFSRRIVLGAHNDILPLTCEETGIVYAMMMPAVAGKGLSFHSPFSSVKNCRAMAQEGAEYLRRLDAQILSGILITLADNYSLFRFQPSDSGAQKNALLRTVDREVLIDAILLIEDWVNSGNAQWLPKLSLILDARTMQTGLNARIREWLRTVVDAIHTPDTESYESALTVHRTISAPTVSKAKKEAIAVRKEFRSWKKEAKEDISDLFKAKKISFKLKTYLTAVLTEENIAAADAGTIALMAMKLDDIDDASAASLAKDIQYFHSKLQNPATDNWDSEEASFSSMAPGVYAQEQEPPQRQTISSPSPSSSNSSSSNSSSSPSSSPSKDSNSSKDSPSPSKESTKEDSSTKEEKPLSFTERLLLKKKLAALSKDASTKQGEQDASF